ncbi:KRFB protein, partial [Serilophus lunatus]|nr:KRFB protein [Serilophus lunatus]NXM75279.1 KRFB protein [Serilophus lunatus]
VICYQPFVNAWNEPCVTSCADSRAVVHPPPVVITFPGPILASCPQESYVGTSIPVPAGGWGGYGGSSEGGSSMGGMGGSYG